MRKNPTTKETLQAWEDELVQFVYRMAWGQKWGGHSIPQHVYKSFATNVGKLSEMFTRDRRSLKSNYFQKKEIRSAYLLYFHLANFVRVRAVLEELKAEIGLDQKLRVLDIGSGMASSAWALADVFGDQVETVVLTDQNKNILSDARSLWKQMVEKKHLPDYRVETRLMTLGDHRTPGLLKRMGEFDLIVGANVLNEVTNLSPAKQDQFFKRLVDTSLKKSGHLVLVEPALQLTSRNLMALRDALLESFDLHTPLPCFHSKVCPLNAETRDWCHFDVTWKPPRLRARLEKTLAHNSGTLKYSYVAFSKSEPKNVEGKARVISDELKLRNEKLILLCTSEGKVKLPILNKKRVWYRGAVKTED